MSDDFKLSPVGLDSKVNIKMNEVPEMGNSDLMMNAAPWVFLSVKFTNENSSNIISKLEIVKEKLGLEFKKSHNKLVYHLFSRNRNLTHKEKTVHLFGASILLLKMDPSLMLLIGSHSVFADILRSRKVADIVEDISEDFKMWIKDPNNFVINADLKVALSHAGIDLISEKLTNEEVFECYKSLRKSGELDNKGSKRMVS